VHPTPHGLCEKRLELAGLDYVNEDPFGVSLAGVSLAVHSGEIVGIAGISGNGQQELAALISGEIAQQQAGRDTIRLIGRAVGDMPAAGRRALGFAFVPEERLGHGGVPDMSLADNVLLTAHGQGLVRHGFIRRGAEAPLPPTASPASTCARPAPRLRPGRCRAATCKSSSWGAK
jgi:simple sugar transport system ATP-binding protein